VYQHCFAFIVYSSSAIEKIPLTLGPLSIPGGRSSSRAEAGEAVPWPSEPSRVGSWGVI
jgi:hypothetical protein